MGQSHGCLVSQLYACQIYSDHNLTNATFDPFYLFTFSPFLYYSRERALSDRLNAVTNPAEITMLTAKANPPLNANFNTFSIVQL